MPKLPVLSGKEVVVLLGKVGYGFSRQKGSHMIMTKAGKRSIPVPNHDPISVGTLSKILKQAEIKNDERLEELLK